MDIPVKYIVPGAFYEKNDIVKAYPLVGDDLEVEISSPGAFVYGDVFNINGATDLIVTSYF